MARLDPTTRAPTEKLGERANFREAFGEDGIARQIEHSSG
jgi:hypothetical protein